MIQILCVITRRQAVIPVFEEIIDTPPTGGRVGWCLKPTIAWPASIVKGDQS